VPPRQANEPLPGAPEPWAPSDMPAYRGRPPYVMTEMIAAEPAVADRLLHRLSSDDLVELFVGAIRDAAADGRPILTTGCGTSEHAAMGVAALLTEALDLPPGREVRAVPPLEAVARPLSDGVLIGISHEGGTRVTNDALKSARAAGAVTALIAASGRSPGAAVAELVICTEEQDQSWCHTVGYLSPLLVGVLCAVRLASLPLDVVAIRSLLEAADDPHPAAATASVLAGCDRLITVGAGVDLVSARELALKVAEGAHMPSTAYEMEAVLHGHLAAATRWTGLVLVLTAPTARDATVMERSARVLAAAKALGVQAAAILSADAAKGVPAEAAPAGRIVLPRMGRIEATAGSLLGSAVALQLLTERLARARGVNPDTIGREDPAQAAAHA
jgi:glucosamine--fructose-6-phosphate aminotransferase (isomerizing)